MRDSAGTESWTKHVVTLSCEKQGERQTDNEQEGERRRHRVTCLKFCREPVATVTGKVTCSCGWCYHGNPPSAAKWCWNGDRGEEAATPKKKEENVRLCARQATARKGGRQAIVRWTWESDSGRTLLSLGKFISPPHICFVTRGKLVPEVLAVAVYSAVPSASLLWAAGERCCGGRLSQAEAWGEVVHRRVRELKRAARISDGSLWPPTVVTPPN